MSARAIKKCPLCPEFTKEHFTIYTDLAHASINAASLKWEIQNRGGVGWDEVGGEK